MISRYECWIKLCHIINLRDTIEWKLKPGAKYYECLPGADDHYAALQYKYLDLHKELSAGSQADSGSD